MKQIAIDGEKLHKIFKERGLMSTHVAADIGVNAGYFSNAKTRGSLSELVATALEVRYNIPRIKYMFVEVEPEPPKPQKATLTREMLYELIYSAVYNAMRNALNE